MALKHVLSKCVTDGKQKERKRRTGTRIDKLRGSSSSGGGLAFSVFYLLPSGRAMWRGLAWESLAVDARAELQQQLDAGVEAVVYGSV